MLVRTEAFRGSGSTPVVSMRPTVVGSVGVAASFAPTYPTGILSGDLLIFAQCVAGESTSIISTATLGGTGSWSSFADNTSAEAGTGRSVRIKLWKLIATGTETGALSNFSKSGGTGTISDAGALIAIRGAHVTIEDNQSSEGQDNPVTAPNLAVASVNRLGILFAMYGDDAGNWTNFTGGTGTDFTVLAQASSGGGADRRVGVFSANMDVGSSGKVESTSRTNDEWTVRGLVLKPA